MNTKPYLNSFEILSGDFRRITEFIEPVDKNLMVFSYRLYELYVRSCTDFESICKETLISSCYDKSPEDMNIYDYRSLEGELSLESLKVGVLLWRPQTAYVSPFEHWSKPDVHPPLQWYSDYNQVKHNRNEKFSFANILNVRIALAGLFALLERIDAIPKDYGWLTNDHEEFIEYTYPGHIFSICEIT